MKRTLLALAFIFSLQLTLFSQTVNHPTIDTVQVAYKGASNSNSVENVLSEASISLKNVAGVSKVYYKIINPADNSTIYSVNYDLNIPSVTNPSGIMLYLKNNTIVQIINPNAIPLKSYTYQIQTEDPQGSLSPVYIFTMVL